MRIIHCADFHLQSAMESYLPPEKARERRNELLTRFTDLISYAQRNRVDAVLIAGDVSDNGALPPQIQEYLLRAMNNVPHIRFFFVMGNHDTADGGNGCFSVSRNGIPDNVTVFDGVWETVTLEGGITVSGRTLPTELDSVTQTPMLPSDTYNIVMLHGELSSAYGMGGAEYAVSVPMLADKNINYLALGHRHTFTHGKLDARCTWGYPGCIEGRGFDECGEKGFLLLNIEARRRGKTEFVPFGVRRFHSIPLDVSDIPIGDIGTLTARMDEVISEAEAGDLVRLILVGEDDITSDRAIGLLHARLNARFYYGEVRDGRRIRLNPESFKNDISLKGEFVRRVLSTDLPEDEKNEIIRTGIGALLGHDGF